ncbi:hypothetical protein, partial [Staphylococcus haemolyticus]|uniref:hypothetical protein n=1 Tax=Staphylococcus haemolyticus TaxID=1283 RepID=UPI0020BF72ED
MSRIEKGAKLFFKFCRTLSISAEKPAHCSPFITRCESERLGFEQNRKGSKTVLQVLSNSEYFCRKT